MQTPVEKLRRYVLMLGVFCILMQMIVPEPMASVWFYLWAFHFALHEYLNAKYPY